MMNLRNDMKVITVKQDSIPKLILKTQNTFNAWIRNRDKDLGCISCGREVQQAGHYLSVGHHAHLRFSEFNCAGQCIRCNLYLSGNLINYRQGLVKRYGENKVLMLEACAHGTKRWSRCELLAIITLYKEKI